MNNSLYERSLKVLAPVAKRATRLSIKTGKGSYLYTEEGTKILDFASGVAVCNVGHNHPKVVKAATDQMNELIHGGHNVVYYESYVRLAERLVEVSPYDSMVYFSNSGAEANDGALKLAKYVTKRPAIISFKGAFHGRTIGSMSITSSNSAYRKNYEATLPSVYFLDYPDLFHTPYSIKGNECPKEYFTQFDDLFDTLVDPYSVAAIIMEPIQGEGGYIVPPKEFVSYVREICDKYGILLIFDEVQTGFGRTGYLFASEYFDIEPDIRTVAKGIASGFPLSAIIAKKEYMEKWSPGAHGGTFGGNPVACAAGLATLDILLDEGIKNAKAMGNIFKNELLTIEEQFSCIQHTRGIGLMLAFEVVDANQKPNEELTSRILSNALKNNLLLLSCGRHHNVIRFIAPTTVTKEEIFEGIGKLKKAIIEATTVSTSVN